jgi:UPF0755 protein
MFKGLNKMSKKKALLSAIIIVPFFTVILLALYTGKILYGPYQGDNASFTIKPGEGFSSVNYRLSKSELISSARVFHYYTKYSDKMSKLKAGTYQIPSGSNMTDILYILTEGTPILSKITIPEGKNMYEIGKLLESKGITTYKEFIKVCKDPDMVKSVHPKAPSLEGYLFPETYMFAPKTPATEVVRAMLTQFKKQTKMLDLEQTFLEPHEVVILASIVEKETGAKVERPTIAGVYLNRLKKKMRLQADPTTIYGIWETYNGNLRKKHLLQKTAYNTYKMSGLPLGPIANPSLAAIKAVLRPQEHNFIFFVSKNDGTHIFTPTYKEHRKAVDYWQKNRRHRKGKSWRDLKQK